MNTIDLSVIIASRTPSHLTRTLDAFKRQSIAGINIELIIVQESDSGFDAFMACPCPIAATVKRQKLHHDYGASAHDTGIEAAAGEYVCFWDDDNLYHPHALTALFCTAQHHDIGIVCTQLNGRTIPGSRAIQAGDIDTMCLGVRRELAAQIKWADGGGRYSDFRWISKVAKLAKTINYSPIIIGEHL